MSKNETLRCVAMQSIARTGQELALQGPLNRLSLKALRNATGDTSQWYVNGFGLKYPRHYFANGGSLEFAANSNAVIAVDGFTSSAITVLDITDPKRLAVVQRLTITPSTAGYCATFVPPTPQSHFTAFESGAGTPAGSLSLGQVAGWSSPANAADYLIITLDSLVDAANALASYRQVGATLAGSYSNNVIDRASQSDLGALRQAIQSSLNTGVDLVDYVGHGAIDRFGNAGYLTSADVPNLQNGARLPVVVAVTCVSGQYSVPGSTYLAEYLLLQGQGGAIAVVAPTGLSVNQDASRLNLRLMQLLRANAQASVGDLFRQALADHVAQNNPATQPTIYNLIGNPATA